MMPLTWCSCKSEQVTPHLLHMLEGAGSNHGYWQTKGSIWLNGHSDTASDFSNHLPFLPLLQYDSFSAHCFHSPSHSQLLVEPKPSCPSSSSDVWMTRRCSERHWTAQCEEASLKSTGFFSLSPGSVKVRPHPPWLPSSHVHSPPLQVPILALWAAQPSMLPSSVRKRSFPTNPWRCGQCFLLPKGWVVYGGYNASSRLFLWIYFRCFSLAIWLWEHKDMEVNSEINLEQQRIHKHPTHQQFDPDVTSFL